MDPTRFREEHLGHGLLESDAADDPMVQFERWFDDARVSGTHQPEAMVVATVDASGRPSSRFVLLRDHGDEGFVFYTDRESDKGRDLVGNDAVALLFPWQELGRQVRVRGRAVRTDDDRSDAYWARRPRASRLAAVTSRQSRPVADRPTLDERYDQVAERHPDDSEIPRPDRWGGYVVRPDEIEFWQQRAHRFHDRLRYRRTDGGWERERLQP